MVGAIQYGGRVTAEADQRVMDCVVSKFLCPGVVERAVAASAGEVVLFEGNGGGGPSCSSSSSSSSSLAAASASVPSSSSSSSSSAAASASKRGRNAAAASASALDAAVAAAAAAAAAGKQQESRQRYSVLAHADVRATRAAIELLPALDPPELFGLHASAELRCRTAQARAALATMGQVLLVGGGGGGSGGGASPPPPPPSSSSTSSSAGPSPLERNADRLAETLLARLLPPPISASELSAGLARQPGGGAEAPLAVQLRQECERLNATLALATADLRSLRRALAGTAALTPSLVLALEALGSGRVPAAWVKKSWECPPRNDAARWAAGASDRARQLSRWLAEGRPRVVWLPGLFNPAGFFTAIKQEAARAAAAAGKKGGGGGAGGAAAAAAAADAAAPAAAGAAAAGGGGGGDGGAAPSSQSSSSSSSWALDDVALVTSVVHPPQWDTSGYGSGGGEAAAGTTATTSSATAAAAATSSSASASSSSPFVPGSILVSGMWLEGAAWDSKTGRLTDPDPRARGAASQLPLLLARAVQGGGGGGASGGGASGTAPPAAAAPASASSRSYEAPIYRVRRRTGDTLIGSVSLRIGGGEENSKWVLRGVAVLCDRE